MKLVGIDPSFKRTGLSIYDVDSQHILINRVQLVVEKKKTFSNVWNDAERIVKEAIAIIKPDSDTYVLSECPPPIGQFAAGLYALDSLLFNALYDSGVKSLFVMYPNWLGHLHGQKKYPKSMSVELAREMLEHLKSGGIEYEYGRGRLSNDEAESFLFLARLGVSMGCMALELESYPKLYESKEMVLFQR